MNPARTRHAAIYARVSTGSQTTENQLRELRQVAERHGWTVVAEFIDNGVSGAKGRDARPGLHKLLQAVARREIDMVMAWSVDRLGRSLQNLVELLGELHGKHVDLYLHQQGVDTSTPGGKALFQMMGVFAEFERAMIRERVRSGVRIVRIREMVDPKRYRRMQRNFLRLHNQFVRGNDRKAAYDYFMLICGPLCVEGQSSIDGGMISALGPDGTLRLAS